MKKLILRKRISLLVVATLIINASAILNMGVLKVNAQTAVNVVNLAASQVGYHEKASNAYLDDYTANSGSKNYNKYARDIGIANGQPWCATFVWWCMAANGIPQSSYPQSAYVPTIKNWFAQRGQFGYRGTYVPKSGDYIIFGDCDHVGIVEHVSGNYVNTIEGNTSNAVKRKSYRMDSTYILGYGVVNYSNDTTPPCISNVVVSDVSESGYTITCNISDESGVSYIAFPTWTHANGQDDLDMQWYLPSGYSYGAIENGVATFRVNTSQHNNELGYYATHIYAQDVNGNKAGPVAIDVLLEKNMAPVVAPEATEPTTEATTEETTEATTEEIIEETTELTTETTTEATTEVPPVEDTDISIDDNTEEPSVEEVESSTETIIENSTEQDNIEIENVTINNNTTNITNNINNTYNYITIQYPDEGTTDLINQLLVDMIMSESADYVPENLEVTQWTGEETAPECDVVVEETPLTVDEGTEEGIVEEADYSAQASNRVVESANSTSVNTPQNNTVIQVQNQDETVATVIAQDSVETVDSETSNEETDIPQTNEDGLVMYTVVNGKRYKISISFR